MKMDRISVIIAAAGSGRRMGSGINKQYIELSGMPVLARSVRAFELNPSVSEIVIAVRSGEEDMCRRRIVKPYGFTKVSAIVSGGDERQDSVRKALARLSADCGYVLIHDGARPLVPQRVIDQVIKCCMEYGAAVPAVEVKDTIKIIDSSGSGAPGEAGGTVYSGGFQAASEEEDKVIDLGMDARSNSRIFGTEGGRRYFSRDAEGDDGVHEGVSVGSDDDHADNRQERVGCMGAGIDSVHMVAGTPDRSTLRAVQTPQGFERSLITEAYELAAQTPDVIFTDDASMVEAMGRKVAVTRGDEDNIKITASDDIRRAEMILEIKESEMTPAAGAAGEEAPHGGVDGGSEPDMSLSADAGGADDAAAAEADGKAAGGGAGYGGSQRVSAFNAPRIGFGFDIHAFAKDRKLILGGVLIPHERGLMGHSDADVLVHAIIDALLGAVGLGDTGRHFPDNDPDYKDISSLLLLKYTYRLLEEKSFEIVNIDCTVAAQSPKIAAYEEQMRKNIADVLKISARQINIKGTTSEGLGFVGREEGIAAQAAALVVPVD